MTPAGRARSPAAGASSGALPSYSPHPTCPPRAAPPSLSLGRSFSQQVFHVSSVLSASLPHDRGSTFPVSHLSGKQAASPTVLHAHEHTCAQVKGWSTGRRGAIGSHREPGHSSWLQLTWLEGPPPAQGGRAGQGLNWIHQGEGPSPPPQIPDAPLPKSLLRLTIFL